MITKIEVDGFKSLSGFELKLQPGLNILVGPNGSGKTNIILFFEFLSKLANNSIGHAVSSIGGAGSIFTKVGKDKYQDTITFKIHGSSEAKENLYIIYEYYCVIKSSFEKEAIYFDFQEIKVKTTDKFWPDPDDITEKSEWDFHIEFQHKESEKSSVIINQLNRNEIIERFFPESMDFLHSTKMKTDMTNFEKWFIDYINKNDLSSEIIVEPLLPFFEPAQIIVNDILGGESFNIAPDKVKEQEDAASPPGIKKDGSGLATTLYAMEKSKPVPIRFGDSFFMESPERSYDPNLLSKIIAYLKLANKTIDKLSVENDPFDNRLIVRLFIKTGDYQAVLPLSSMSDGTIKWLTLITAILTSRTIFSIEEPENFLHPWMQAEIAKIMREHIEQKKSQSFIIMTTHSESLLNSINPEEVILVDLVQGRTSAKRIANIQDLKYEISHSGFGLGHFYFSDSIEV